MIDMPWKRVSALLAFAICALPVTAQERDFPPLPPLNDPPTELRLEGKFVWADLFTTDVAASRDFYSKLFDWEWRQVSEARAYGIFYRDDVAVAGLARRDPPDQGEAYGTWVYYASVSDVDATQAQFVERGGQALLPPRSAPERGQFAILADPDGAIMGILRSDSGDPDEYQAALGEFIWYELFTHDVNSAAEFYSSLFGYEVYDKENTPDLVDYILSSNDYSRAGIGELPEDSGTVPTWLGFIRVEDVAATVARAQELGGRTLLPPDANRLDGDLAIIADPEGTPVGLLRWTYPETVEARP